MDLTIPPLDFKILLESNPLPSRNLVRRLAVALAAPESRHRFSQKRRQRADKSDKASRASAGLLARPPALVPAHLRACLSASSQPFLHLETSKVSCPGTLGSSESRSRRSEVFMTRFPQKALWLNHKTGLGLEFPPLKSW